MNCSIEGCSTPTAKGGHGLCGMHYARKRRGGRHLEVAGYVHDPRHTHEHRVFARLREDSDGCWVWQGAKSNGYGVIGIDGAIVYLHRWTYEHLIGPIPEGLVLDHLCCNRACANPWHLDPVTRAINNERGGTTHGTRARAAA